jgi:membrane associated rhomboid family serine protease
MFQSLTPVTGALIVANVIVYLLQNLLGDQVVISFALWPPGVVLDDGSPLFHGWQLLTYGFLHGSPQHLFFNMFALYMFGSDIERLFGRQRYLIYYFVCVIGAAVAQLIVNHLMHSTAPTLGASGGVFGLLLAFGMAYPQRRIMLIFPPIPMPAWVFVTGYGVIELFMGITQTQQGVAHFAHLGGMAGGFALIQYWRRRPAR